LSAHITVPARPTALPQVEAEQPQPEPFSRTPPVESPESSRQPAVESLSAVEQLQPLQDVVLRIAPEAGELPGDRAQTFFADAGRTFHEMGTSRETAEWLFHWEAPAMRYRPLYFEEINLERYGYTVGWMQPAVSAAHFFGRIPALPYLMVSENARQCRYALGHGRPGDCVPFYCHRAPLRLDAAALEAAVVAGAIIAFP